MSEAITPFKINVSNAELGDLRSRLADTRWARPAPTADWSRGVPLDYLKGLAAYWADGLRLAAGGGGAQSAAAVHHGDRRPDLSFRACEIEGGKRAAAAALPWLAGLVRRVRQGHRAADRSGGAWRQGRGCVRRGDPVAAWASAIRRRSRRRAGICRKPRGPMRRSWSGSATPSTARMAPTSARGSPAIWPRISRTGSMACMSAAIAER